MEDVLETIVRGIWEVMFPRLEVRRRGGEVASEVEAAVEYAGGWEGALVVRCSAGLARRLATEFYGRPATELREDDDDDVISELVNVAGGHLGSALPGHPRLSLPVVRRGARVERTGPCRGVVMDVEGEGLAVELWG